MCVAAENVTSKPIQGLGCVAAAFDNKKAISENAKLLTVKLPDLEDKIKEQTHLNQALKLLEKQHAEGTISEFEYQIKKTGLKIAGAVEFPQIINCVA